MKKLQRGEVWLVDLGLGLAAKIRPCLVLSVPLEDADRSLVTLIPHTTSLRGSRFEAIVPVKFLRSGGFDVQGSVTIPTVRLIRHLGTLSPTQLQIVEASVCIWLGLSPNISQEVNARH